MIQTILTFIVIVVPALYFGYNGQTAEMGLGIVLGAIAGAFLNLDKFERFKGAGFEAELKKAVTEAYATIENMKEVAKPLIITSLSNMTYGGRYGGSPEENEEKQKSELIQLSKTLEIYEGEVAAAVDEYHHFNILDRYNRIINLTSILHNPQVDRLGTLLSISLNSIYSWESKIYPSEQQIRDIFKQVAIDNQDSINEYENAIQDYLYYLEKKSPRRSGTQ